MLFIIPDKILEELICSTCHKYLSVKPVKVYPNRTKKCGRCSKDDDDEGVVSLFDMIADQGLFKCINRYDGCRVLLANVEVPDHEENCKSKSYPCPVCLESKDVPSYLLTEHFEREHKANLLSRSSFNIYLNGSNEVNRIFLYKQEDTLFIISSKVDLNGGFPLLSASQVARNDKINKQKFFINWEEANIMETETKICSYFGAEELEGFQLEISETKPFQFMNVEFRLEVDGSSEMMEVSVTEIISPIPVTEEAENEEQEASNGDKSLKTRQSRKIYLSESFLQKNPFFSVCSNGRELTTRQDIPLHCFKCHEICTSQEDYIKGNYYYYRDTNRFNFICYPCNRVYPNANVDTQTFSSESILEYSVYHGIEYLCKRNCGKTFDNSKIHRHEIYCKNLPPQVCPVRHCDTKASLWELETKHITKSHLSTGHIGIKYYINDKKRKLLLNTNFELPKEDARDVYVWVSHMFFHVTVDWSKTKCEVEFSICGERTGDRFQAKVLYTMIAPS
ncbi:hypothetical protein JTB14_001811 [Gonioctena quinquepunctata]|nr:hypothetical protein JTB14_001811 [Gonioctena quinquepunctata]